MIEFIQILKLAFDCCAVTSVLFEMKYVWINLKAVAGYFWLKKLSFVASCPVSSPCHVFATKNGAINSQPCHCGQFYALVYSWINTIYSVELIELIRCRLTLQATLIFFRFNIFGTFFKLPWYIMFNHVVLHVTLLTLKVTLTRPTTLTTLVLQTLKNC